jgi:pimeloyl-ACP methyl ester carboxylesterase
LDQQTTKTKPILVFIPGTLCTETVFQPLLRYLNYPSITIRFTHQSTLTDMASEVKRRVGERPFIPVGFSMGGMVAFELIRQFESQIRGLCLVCSNCHSDSPERAQSRQEHLNIAKKQNLATLMKDIYLPVYFQQTSNELAQLVVDMANELGIETFQAQLNVLAERPDSIDLLKVFNLPSLVIGGQYDIPCPPEHQCVMASALPDSELHLIDKAGHFALLEYPLDIATIIQNWVEKHYAEL